LNFLADESVDQNIVVRLRKDGHSVWYVAEMEPGVSDSSILKKASEEQMVLLTADKDFGELVFRQRQLTTGVVLLRLAGLSQQLKSETVAVTIQQHNRELDHCFSVISPGHIRIRKSLSP
jgi:predicted nuclease of predicted toxin-antitoxin system